MPTELYRLHPQVGRRLEPEKLVLNPHGISSIQIHPLSNVLRRVRLAKGERYAIALLSNWNMQGRSPQWELTDSQNLVQEEPEMLLQTGFDTKPFVFRRRTELKKVARQLIPNFREESNAPTHVGCTPA